MFSPPFRLALTSSTHHKADQMHDKAHPHMDSWSSSPYRLQNQGYPLLFDDVATTPAANEEVFAFLNALGRGQSFLLVYLPCWMGNEPVSSVYFRPRALILSCSCTGNDRWDVIGLYQCNFDGCKYCFAKNQQYALNVQDDGSWEGQNATIERRLDQEVGIPEWETRDTGEEQNGEICCMFALHVSKLNLTLVVLR